MRTTIRAFGTDCAVTNTVVSYADGRTKETLLNGVVKTAYEYGPNWTKTYEGPAGLASPRWSCSYEDALGRTVCETRPGFRGALLVTSNEYNTANQLVATRAYALNENSTPTPLTYTYFCYNSLGQRNLTVSDMNLNQQIDWSDTDRVVSNDTRYVQLAGDWWRESSSWQTRKNGSSALTRVGLTRTRLTGLSQTGGALCTGAAAAKRSLECCVSPAQNEGDQNHCPPPPRLSTFQWTYLQGSDLKSSLSYPNGLTASWTYDANNQLLQVRNATPTNVISQFDYTYDAAGRRVSIAKSGTAFGDLSGSIDSYTYNARSELTSARRTKDGQPIPGFSEDFDYDPIGNRRTSATYNEKGEAQTSTYQANNLNQYTSRTTPGYAAVRGEAAPEATVTVNENPTFRLGSYYFGSDLFDNSTAGGLANLETYATLAQTAANGEETEDLVSSTTNQVYLAQSPESFAYDDDGNQTLITTKTGLWRVTYNGENRPILWVRDSDNATLTMTYDHMGRRREKNAQRFFYDGYLQVVDNIGNAYTWDCTESVATRPLSWLCDDSVACYVHDGNKNVREVVAVDGSHVAHYGYAPFGTVTISSGSSAALNPWRFSSEYADDELGCDYYNYREYEPVSGRWTSRDFVEGGGLAVYGFCENGPCCRIDYIGLYRLSLITNETTEDDALLWFISREMQKNPYHEIRTGMSSVEEVLKAMEDSVSKHAEKITQLDLSGHGFSDAVGVQFKRSGFIVEKLTADQKQRIKACMASNARIVFWSCQTASTEKQKGTLQAFANEMELRIKAKDGYVRSGPDGDSVDYLVDIVAYLIVKGELGGGWKEFRPTQKEIPCKEDGPKAYLISKKE